MDAERTGRAALVQEQRDPEPRTTRPIWEMVIDDMHARDQEGRRKYGMPLQAHNGRDPLVDAYQEALDQCVYLRQAIAERDGNRAVPDTIPDWLLLEVICAGHGELSRRNSTLTMAASDQSQTAIIRYEARQESERNRPLLQALRDWYSAIQGTAEDQGK